MAIEQRPHPGGMITFAAVLLLVAGIYNIVWGIEGATQQAFLDEGLLPGGGLSAWSWSSIVFGVLEIVACFLLFARRREGAAVGIVLAIIGMTYWFGVMPAQPIMSFAAILLLVIVIYALAVHRHELE